MTECAQSLDWYNWKDDQFVCSNDLYYCLGDYYVSVMTSQGDTNMCAHINTPLQNVWRAETFSS